MEVFELTLFPISPLLLKSLLISHQIEANYDQEEARKCLYWIRCITGVEEIPDNPDQIDTSADNFHNLFKDGMILCKYVNNNNK